MKGNKRIFEMFEKENDTRTYFPLVIKDCDELADIVLDAVVAAMDRAVSAGANMHGIDYAGEGEFLCRSETQAECIADFLDALGLDVTTGYYDPEEDERSGETDSYTGYYYVDIQ